VLKKKIIPFIGAKSHTPQLLEDGAKRSGAIMSLNVLCRQQSSMLARKMPPSTCIKIKHNASRVNRSLQQMRKANGYFRH